MATIQVIFLDNNSGKQCEITTIENNLEPQQLSQVLNHILCTNKKYKFMIENKLLDQRLNNFLESYNIETEEAIFIVYFEFYDHDQPDFEYENNDLISFSVQTDDSILFSDYNGSIKKFDIASKTANTIYKHDIAIYMFTKNTEGIFFVDENNSVSDLDGNTIFKSIKKIVCISSNRNWLAFATINSEIYLFDLFTKKIQKLDVTIPNIASLDCSEKLRIVSLERGLVEIDYNENLLVKNICEDGITCYVRYCDETFLGTYKGFIIRLDSDTNKKLITTETRYVKHITIDNKTLAYSNQYTVLVLSKCFALSTYQINIEKEINGLFWYDGILMVASGSQIRNYKLK